MRLLPLVLLLACAHEPFRPTAATRRPCDGPACVAVVPPPPRSLMLGDGGITALRSLSGEAFDVAWLSQMLAHHEAALHLARRGLQLDHDPAARAAAAQVVEDDAAEAAEIRRVLGERYHRGPDHGQMSLVRKDVMALAHEPIRTRADFLRAMIALDARAIELSRLARANAEHAETLAVAERILGDEAADVAIYRGLLAG